MGLFWRLCSVYVQSLWHRSDMGLFAAHAVLRALVVRFCTGGFSGSFSCFMEASADHCASVGVFIGRTGVLLNNVSDHHRLF